MIKILIVDDDIEMLNGLENIIDWNMQGFEIVGKAENGVEALEIASKNRPDILITDISMPSMDGFSLIKGMKDVGINFKIILLTCHEDFKYAKEAITLNVDEYLVKYTLTEESLVTTLQKLKLQLYEEEFQKRSLYKYSNEIRHNKGFFKEKLLCDIVDNKIKSMEVLKDKGSLHNILFPDSNFRGIGLFIDNYENVINDSAINDRELLSFSICNIVEEIFLEVKNITLFPHGNDFLLLYWDATSDVRVKQIIIDFLQKVQRHVFDILKIELSICISGVFESIWRVNDAITETKKLRESYFYTEGRKFVQECKEYDNTDINLLYKKYCEPLKILLENNEVKQLKPIFNETCEELFKSMYQPQNIKKLFNKIAADLDLGLSKFDVHMGNVKVTDDSYVECKNRIIQMFDVYIKEFEQRNNYNYSNDVKKVVEYINANLDKDISLETAASYIYKNSSYLSRMFKKETGFNFSEYLIKRRIEKATILLSETELPVEKVCTQVGIENVYYFYRFYKKETGKTPGEIRGKK